MRKKIIFVFLFIFIIINIYNNCFAFTIDSNGSSIELPDLPSETGDDFYIHRESSSGGHFIYYLDIILNNGSVTYNENDDKLVIINITRYRYRTKYPSQGWTSIGDISNIYAYNPDIIYSTINIYYSNSDEIYYESNVSEEPLPINIFGNDTLYIGDIPLDYIYADFNNSYIDLYNVSSATNETLNGYRIYFYDNTFMYKEISNIFTDTVNFTKINVSDKVYYRRDFPYICLTTFIIIIFFLWITNLFTTIIYKGGILRGLF